MVPSKAAARRAIAEGGAYLNNVRIHDQEAMLTTADLLHGRFAIVRQGQAHGRRCHGSRAAERRRSVCRDRV